MARTDLLALTLDDLAAFSNVGLARRAQKEIESGTPAYSLTEDDTGNVRVAWADDIICDLPANSSLAQSVCSCPATGMCRHLLRAVLAYQKEAAANYTADVAAHATATPIWSPGDISDDTLGQYLSAATLNRARRSFDEGQVIEVRRGTKPTAYLHNAALTVRFLVAGDLRYTRCECTETQPCSHVALAIWGFRRLAADQTAGIVDSRRDPYPVPDDLLTDISATLDELATYGVANAPPPLWDGLRRLDARCRAGGLIWPAEIIAELVLHGERYAARDARFAADEVAGLIGELGARMAAIRSQPPGVPQLYVRGAAQDGATQVGAARLIGVGCGVRLKRRSIEVAAYMQNVETGHVVTLRQEFVEADPAQVARPFWQMAGAMVAKSGALSALGVGQLLMKGGKRTADAGLSLSRSQSALNPQTFYWEGLRSPLLAESLAELRAHLDAQPPSALRPRRLTEDLFVCAVVGAGGDPHFEPISQTVVATMRDADGETATLRHPFTTRGQAGCEAMLAALSTRADTLRFVSGMVRATPGGLVIAPVALVFQDGATRTTIQPWVAPPTPDVKTTLVAPSTALFSAPDPIADYVTQLSEGLGELWLLGLARADGRALRRWRDLHAMGAERGFVRFLGAVAAVGAWLQQSEDSLSRDYAGGAARMRDLSLLVRLAHDVA